MSSSKAPTDPTKTQPDSRDPLSSRLDELIHCRALMVGRGHQLTLDKAGLPIVVGFDPKAEVKLNLAHHQRLKNVIRYLESPIAPQSVDWIHARQMLCKLRDQDVAREGEGDIMAWKIAMAAHDSTMRYLSPIESLLEELKAKKTDVNQLNRIRSLAQRFPERACHLVGIPAPDDLDDNAWDDGLAEAVLNKSSDLYRRIHQAWSAILDGQRRSFLGLSTEPERNLHRFLDHNVIKALKEWKNHDVFLILERKAITAQRSREPSVQTRGIL
ncbi:hypothetical protein ACHAPT_000160 [Fusarium lateritium]